MEYLGETLKEIRESIGLTQKQLSEGIMTQSNYSKVEKGVIEITFNNMIELLDRFGMSVDEFLYIHNGYENNPATEIMRFDKMFSNDRKTLHMNIRTLSNKTDKTTREKEMLSLNRALLFILDNKYDEAAEEVEMIWNRLENHDNWHLHDLRLINSMLYIFPIDEAKSIVSMAKERLNKYKQLRSVTKLSANFQMNYILLLIKNDLFVEALDELNSFITYCVTNDMYSYLATSYIRKGILLNIINNEHSTEWYEKGFHIFELVDKSELIEEFKEEIQFYTGYIMP